MGTAVCKRRALFFFSSVKMVCLWRPWPTEAHIRNWESQLTAGNLCFKLPPFQSQGTGSLVGTLLNFTTPLRLGNAAPASSSGPQERAPCSTRSGERRGLQGCLLGWNSWGWGGELGFLLQVRPWVSGRQPCSCVARLTLLESHWERGRRSAADAWVFSLQRDRL